MDTRKYTTITIPVELSATLRKLAIDDRLRMVELLKRMIDAYNSRKQNIDFVDNDLKEMRENKKATNK